MPNWCSNTLEVSHDDKKKIDQLEKFLEERDGKEFFDFFVEPAKGEDWYTYNLDMYGCKWNCDASHYERTSDNSMYITFDSPWSPPTHLYENMETNDFGVYAEYHESGIGFVGKFEYGEDECWEYHNDIEAVPEDLAENWNLYEEIALLEEENEDESSDR